MSRPRAQITDPKKKKAHEAHLARRRERHLHAKSLEALQEGDDGGADFEKLVAIEKAKKPLTPHQRAGSHTSSPKRIAAARENLTQAFDLMGGVSALVVWGRKNPTEFYRLWARLIPKESVEVSASLPLEALLAKLSSREELSVSEAAYQIGTDMLAEARYQVIEQDGPNFESQFIDEEDDTI